MCLPLLWVDAMTVPFWVLYVIAGTTDMFDGFLARRWGVESKFGVRLSAQSQQIDGVPALYRHDGNRTFILHPCCMDDFLHRPLRSHIGRAFYS